MQILSRYLRPIVLVIKKNGTSKVINNHVPCGYSISVVNNHNNTNKQTYYRGDNAVSKLCKEIRAIAYKKLVFARVKWSN